MQDSGSKAVIAASTDESLGNISTLIAPWCLLNEAITRGAVPQDITLATQAIDKTLQGDGLSFPATAQISVKPAGAMGLVSFTPNEEAADEYEPKAFDPEAGWERQQAARKTSETYLRGAKAAGASMVTRTVKVDVARILVERCPDVVSKWLEGLDDEPTQALISRLNLAGGFFLSLCEVLLETDAKRGVLLWRALRQHLSINFLGVGGLNELLLMIFRAPDNPEVRGLREQLFLLSQNTTDEAYLDLVLAALSQGSGAWLEAYISRDEDAPEPFRRKRAILLKGFLPTEPTFEPAWRDDQVIGTWHALRIRAQETRNRASYARHWWQSYLAAPDALSAFCAWQVFLGCVDKMAWVWIRSDIESYKQDNELWRLKMLHLQFNESAINDAIRDKSRKGSQTLDKHLIGWESPTSWFPSESLNAVGY